MNESQTEKYLLNRDRVVDHLIECVVSRHTDPIVFRHEYLEYAIRPNYQDDESITFLWSVKNTLEDETILTLSIKDTPFTAQIKAVNILIKAQLMF